MNRPGPGSLDPQGPVAEAIAELWWLMLILGTAAFLVFAFALGVSLFKRRPPEEAGESDTEDSSSRRWIIWGGVVMPVILLVVVLVPTIGAMRATPADVPAGGLEVEIIGHQWWYEVRYPAEGIETANELNLPVGRPVALRLTSADVIHSFWVPALGGKIDLLPERTNTLVIQADEPGEHVSRCAEFCGLQHTLMAMVVVAQPEEDFAAWVAERRRPAAEASGEIASRGRDIFFSAGCASCHTVAGTDARGESGPDLTHLASRSTLGAATVPNTPDRLEQWIRDPHEIKRGVKMPGAELSGGDMEALLAYLESLR